jgi:hypothetical protein
MGADQLDRLDTIAARLATDPGHNIMRLLVARGGFTAELERIASRRPDRQLVDLHRLYHGS